MDVNLQVERYNLNKVLVKGTVTRITAVTEGEQMCQEDSTIHKEALRQGGGRRKKRVKYFQVQLEDGAMLKAHRVVMATGPTRAQMANIPQWVTDIEESYPEERLQHTVHLMHALSRAQQNSQDTDSLTQEDFVQKTSKDHFNMPFPRIPEFLICFAEVCYKT